MKLRQFLNEIEQMVKANPEKMDCEVIYSSDDEGNYYQKVHNSPCWVHVENLNKYDMDLLGMYADEATDIEDCNAIIIN